MTRDLFFFWWHVDTAGYVAERRIPTEDEEQLVIIRRPSVELGRSSYRPIREETGLFRIFANLDYEDSAQITEFANSYGLLGEGVFIDPEGGQGALEGGELFRTWAKEIDHMQRALRLWDCVQARDNESLKQYIHWEGTRSVEYQKGRTRIVIANEDSNREYLDRFPPGDVSIPAERLVQTVINKQIDGRVSPRLLWDEGGTKLRLYLVPKNLVGAMWLQFSQAVDGNIQFLVCPECEKPFAVNKSARGKPRIYCSASCRSRAHHKRSTGGKQ